MYPYVCIWWCLKDTPTNRLCTHSLGEEIPIPEDTDQKMPGDRPEHPVSTHYHLRGIVVHSGQASGGHYYSFIRLRCVCGGGAGVADGQALSTREGG